MDMDMELWSYCTVPLSTQMIILYDIDVYKIHQSKSNLELQRLLGPALCMIQPTFGGIDHMTVWWRAWLFLWAKDKEAEREGEGRRSFAIMWPDAYLHSHCCACFHCPVTKSTACQPFVRAFNGAKKDLNNQCSDSGAARANVCVGMCINQ